MSLKKIKIIGLFGIFFLCFPFHFLYDWFPNGITSIFCSVNESIWEHMKLLMTSYLVYSFIEYFILKKYSISVQNFILQIWLVPILGILLYLVCYLPLYRIFKENMIISITLLFLVIIVEQWMSYKILNEREIKFEKEIGIFGIIITYILFGYLTYHPPIEEIFYDVKHQKYGIHTYIKK